MRTLKSASLILDDGTIFRGKSFGYDKSVSGEVVFNTAMTGYPESLTDPSYKGQLLAFTYPIIGNYGVPANDFVDKLSKFYESENIHVKAVIISDYSFEYSHWNAQKTLAQWLQEEQITGIFDIDTRALTKHLRERGSMTGKIVIEGTKSGVGSIKVNFIAGGTTQGGGQITAGLKFEKEFILIARPGVAVDANGQPQNPGGWL